MPSSLRIREQCKESYDRIASKFKRSPKSDSERPLVTEAPPKDIDRAVIPSITPSNDASAVDVTVNGTDVLPPPPLDAMSLYGSELDNGSQLVHHPFPPSPDAAANHGDAAKRTDAVAASIDAGPIASETGLIQQSSAQPSQGTRTESRANLLKGVGGIGKHGSSADNTRVGVDGSHLATEPVVRSGRHSQTAASVPDVEKTSNSGRPTSQQPDSETDVAVRAIDAEMESSQPNDESLVSNENLGDVLIAQRPAELPENAEFNTQSFLLGPNYKPRAATQVTGSADFNPHLLSLGPRRLARAASTAAETAITSRSDLGEEFQELYLRQLQGEARAVEDGNGNNSSQSSPSHGGSLKRFKEQIRACEVRGSHKSKEWFIPGKALVRIITESSVIPILDNIRLDEWPIAPTATVAEMAAQICPASDADRKPSFRKVLATLILSDNLASIVSFLQHEPPISDSDLPLHLVVRHNSQVQGLARRSSPDYPGSNHSIIAFTKTWSQIELKDFDQFQWHLCPVFFGVKGDKDTPFHTKVHFTCPAGTIMPFSWKSGNAAKALPDWDPTCHPPGDSDRNSTGTEERLPAREGNSTASDTTYTQIEDEASGGGLEGGQGSVSFHRIHPNQQDMKRYTTDGKQRDVAVKLLHSTSRQEFEKEYNMLVKLTPLLTPHLAKLLATYEIPMEGERVGRISTAPRNKYYLMFERADSSLHELLKIHPHVHSPNRAQLGRWVAKQCLGLTKAIASIHNYHFSNSAEGPGCLIGQDSRRHGFHGDIKPSNILLYRNWIDQDDPLGLLQITDFGLSSFHHTVSALDINVRMYGHHYRPPESQLLVLKTTQSHDIWTFGCLFLDILTWLVLGPDAFKDFLEVRRTPGLAMHTEIYYYDAVEEDGRTVLTISKGVLTWARKLCAHKNSSKFVCEFVDLITRHMLVVENTGFKSSVAEEATMRVIRSRSGLWPDKRINATELAKRLGKLDRAEDAYYETYTPKDVPDLGTHDESCRQAISLSMSFGELKQRADAAHSRLEQEKKAMILQARNTPTEAMTFVENATQGDEETQIGEDSMYYDTTEKQSLEETSD